MDQFSAGQWLDTFVPGQAKPGGFTIASAPAAAQQASAPYLELAVQEAPENPAAAWLWQPKKDILGKELQVRVGGSFICPPPEGLDGIRHVVLVAGGVGVNPLMSILGYLADESKAVDLRVSVLYSAKKPADGDVASILFLDRMRDLFRQGKIAGRMRLFMTGTGPEPSADQAGAPAEGFDITYGRMTNDDLLGEVRTDGSRDGRLVYVCGPPAMTDQFVELLTAPAMGSTINPSHVKFEKWW